MTPPRLALLACGLLIGLLTLPACGDSDYRPRAIGRDAEIVVVMDSVRWEGAVGEAVRQELARPIETLPVAEPAFDLSHVNLLRPSDLEAIKTRKNVVIIAPLNDSTNEASVLRSTMAPDARQAVSDGGTVVASRPELWRRGQQVFFIAAGTPERLIETINNRGPALRDSFNLLTRQNMRREMFDRGRQPEVEQDIMDGHGFAVNVQHDYVTVADTSTTDSTAFVALARIVSDQSWRRLFVWYQDGGDPATLTPAWVQATRDSLARSWIQGNTGGFPRIDRRRPLETREVDFMGRDGYEVRGLWHLVDVLEDGSLRHYGGGGPFVSYAFYDEGQDRLYLIDGMVFAPDYDKREFLRQMEVIAHTFRTGTPPEEAPVTAATE